MLRTLSRGQLVFDLAVPGGILVVLLLPYTLFAGSPGGPTVLVGMCAALAFWRLNPGIALAIAWATSLLQMGLGQSPDPTDLAIFVVLYATAAYGTRPVLWLGFASAFAGAAAIALYTVLVPRLTGVYGLVPDPGGLTRETLVAFFVFLALFLLAWTFGRLARSLRTTTESRIAQAEAEVEEQRARREVAVEQERTRIARDMHDVVAHSLAVVIAQADGARYARSTDPRAVDAALTTISGTARDALGDVRALLAQLRHSQAPGPQPVLEDLGRLLDQMRAAGLRVEHRVVGAPGPLGAGAQLALYRIVQEALTNALRHGDPAAPCTVDLTWTESEVLLRIANRMREVPESHGPGHGIAGMRERAALAGGILTATAAGEEFVVAASVPRAGGTTGAVPVLTAGETR